jgi:hypothetical protein
MWPTIGSVLAAVALVAILVAPAFADSHHPSMDDVSVSPGSGTTATTFTFDVAYQDPFGHPPTHVQVIVGNDVHEMHWTGGHDWHHGVRFDWSGTAPAGTHAITFQAWTWHHDHIRLSAGSITVSVPATPTSKPTPKPTHKPTPTPHPTHKPTHKPGHQPTHTPKPTSTPAPDHTPAPTVSDPPTSSPPIRPHGHPGSGPDTTSTGDPALVPSFDVPTTPAPSASPQPSDDQVAVVVPGIVGRDGNDDDSGNHTAAARNDGPASGIRTLHGGPLEAVLATLGVATPELPVLPFIPTVVTTSGAAAASMALGLFGRRRRDDDQPATDEVLAAAAADGIGVGNGAAVGVPIEASADDDTLDDDLEALLPRWRRPSLLQARHSDPLRTEVAAPRLTFQPGFSASLTGLERRKVRYTVVRLLDIPDELRGREIGAVGEGDEVDLLQKQGSYWLVLCPNGGQGWLHQMTLGEILQDAPSAARPASTPSFGDESSNAGDAEVDDDVLAAYLASRRLVD